MGNLIGSSIFLLANEFALTLKNILIRRENENYFLDDSRKSRKTSSSKHSIPLGCYREGKIKPAEAEIAWEKVLQRELHPDEDRATSTAKSYRKTNEKSGRNGWLGKK